MNERTDFFASQEWFHCLASYGLPEPRELISIDYAADAETVLRFYGMSVPGSRELANLSSFYTTQFPLLAGHSSQQPEAIRSLVNALVEYDPAWHEIRLSYLLEDAEILPLLHRTFRELGFRPDFSFQYVNHYSWVSGRTSQEYMAGRPSRVLNTLKRKHRKLNREHRVCIRLASDKGDDLEKAIEDYLQIYRLSWKQAEVCRDFIPKLIRLCAELGFLRLGIMSVDEAPVAAQLWIVENGTAHIYKLAHDPAFERYSVGTILMADLLRHVIDVDGVDRLDFGVGDELYKRDWMEQKRRVIALEAINTSTIPGKIKLVKRLLRNSLRRLGLRAYIPVDF